MFRHLETELASEAGLDEFDYQSEEEAEFERLLEQVDRAVETASRGNGRGRVETEAGRRVSSSRTAQIQVLGAPNSPLVDLVTPAHPCGLLRPNGTLRKRSLSSITHVVIHSLVAGYAGVIDRWRRGLSCHKPHYVIKNDGEITQIVDESIISIHGNGANNYSVGIEHDGYYKDPRYLTEAMYRKSAALTRDICLRHNIPMDDTRVIGHDQAPGTTHGDPGGYWDWDYYLALVRWDGDAPRRPIRIALDCNSSSFSPSSSAWRMVNRLPIQHGPHPKHSYGSKYFRALSTPGINDPAVFRFNIQVSGDYDVSAWWPVSAQNNPNVTISVFTGSAPPPVLSRQVNQNSIREKSRRTLALPATPKWFSLGTVPLRAGEAVRFEVSRRSSRKGWVNADAVRLLKR